MQEENLMAQKSSNGSACGLPNQDFTLPFSSQFMLKLQLSCGKAKSGDYLLIVVWPSFHKLENETACYM